MKIHCFQHSHLGGDVHLPHWAAANGHEWMASVVPALERLPGVNELECLVVMGGPMSVWEEDRYPWLSAEKRLLEAMLAAGRPVLGVCLGAQLLADVLGARTYRGEHPEIGWHRVEATADSRTHVVGGALPDAFETFLWHGDTFDIPVGAAHLARSAAFESQGFAIGSALGLQFHLEVRPDWVHRIAQRDAGALVPGAHVQSLETVLGKPRSLYRDNNAILDRLLGRWIVAAGSETRDGRSAPAA